MVLALVGTKPKEVEMKHAKVIRSALLKYYAKVAVEPPAPTPAQQQSYITKAKEYPKPRPKAKGSRVNLYESKLARHNRRVREGNERSATPPKLLSFEQPKVEHYPGVGLIQIQQHMTPRLPAAKAWARAVPRYLRRPGKPRTVK